MDTYDDGEWDGEELYAPSQLMRGPAGGAMLGQTSQARFSGLDTSRTAREPAFAFSGHQTARVNTNARLPQPGNAAPRGYRDLGSRPFQQPATPFLPQEEDYDDNSDPLPDNWRPHDSPANDRPAQGIAGRTRLRPVSDLPDAFRRCYRFAAFNAVQSECFDTVFNTDENVVIGAPTGSGKTVLFELAIFRTFQQDQTSRVVYVAPTKSLCHERAEDWKNKFRALGIVCTELTGDTSGTSTMSELKRSHIIITTPEKWDSVTRRWRDNEKLLSHLRLFCMDEVHILNEDRGAVLEVVVSRMKTMGQVIRFMAVSATVPNIEDVASWLGPNSSSRLTAKTHNFGDEYRPVVLEKHVYGYDSRNMNDFQFSAVLNAKIMELVQKHSSGKPVLVFCNTRKSCVEAAGKLVGQYKKLVEEGRPPWPVPANNMAVAYSDKKLQELTPTGIAFHHAGLSSQDRQAVEQAFVRGSLHVICTTSTLAVGVNLPARMVVIRGTKQWDPANGGSTPYSDLDLMQMMGRAVRGSLIRIE